MMKKNKQPKNVLAILGSPRPNGLVATMLKHAVQQAEQAGHSVSQINLYEQNLNYCTGCQACYQTQICVQQDDIQNIVKMLRAADIVILAAPVYWGNVPAPVKNLFDRLLGTAMLPTATFPQPRLAGRQYLLLTACHTPAPWHWLFNQSRGAFHCMEEFFKTAGMRPLGKVVCPNTEKIHTPSPAVMRRISKAFC